MGKASQEPVWYSPADVARFVGLSKQTVIRAIVAGRIEAIQSNGGHYRIHRDEFKRYQASLSIAGGCRT